MLISTMNDQELTQNVWGDYATLKKSSTLERLHEEYHQERRRKKIRPELAYSRCYKIRTKAKNNWMIFLQKAPIVDKYRSKDDIVYYSIVYYFSAKGLIVFKPDSASDLIFVYQWHVFTRYCQRMQVSLDHPLEIIQHFFTYNTCAEHQITQNKRRFFSIGICRDGALLGDYRDDVKWVYNKTFVNREVYYRYQEKAEFDLLKDAQRSIIKSLTGKLAPQLTSRQANVMYAIFSP